MIRNKGCILDGRVFNELVGHEFMLLSETASKYILIVVYLATHSLLVWFHVAESPLLTVERRQNVFLSLILSDTK
jgi:hypothetical protein